MMLVSFVLGAVLPVQMWQLSHQQERRSARARGRVVGVTEVDRHDESTTTHITLHPRVQFAAGGRQHEFVSAYGNSWSRPAIGSSVEVRYDPHDPANADVDRNQNPALMRGGAVLAALAGVVLFLFAVL